MNTHFHHLRSSTHRGYIAIVSAIILSAILTALSISESTGVFWARFSELDAIHHTQSTALSYSCAYEALVAYAENPDSMSPQNLLSPKTLTILPGIMCSIVRSVPNPTGVTLYIESTVSGAQVFLVISANKNSDISGIPWS